MATKQNVKAAINLLSRARNLLSNGHWTQGVEHTTTSTGKDQFCAMGAIKQAGKGLSATTRNVAIEALASVLPTPGYPTDNARSTIIGFNDGTAFRARQVTRKMGKAIQSLRSLLGVVRK